MANKVKWLVNAQSMIEKMVNIEKNSEYSKILQKVSPTPSPVVNLI